MGSDYLDQVREHTTPISKFGNSLIDELDMEEGGFPCMHGHTDHKRLVLIADYLIQSLIGVASALEDAALATQTHKERVTSDDYWMNAQSRAVAQQNPRASNDDFLKALQRGQHEERRDREIGASAAHAFIHMTQALDRTAAAIAIVGALDIDVLRVGWSDLDKAAREARPLKRPFHAASEEGHDIQRGLLDLTDKWRDYGPRDWLPWLVGTRNAAAHRAPMTSWYLLKVPGGRGDGLLRPFAAQPSRSEVDAFRHGGEDATHPLGRIILVKESTEVLGGLLDSLSRYLDFVVSQLREVWDLRRTNVRLVVQPGRQWKLHTTPLAFPGYGPTPPVQRDGPVHVPPSLGRRYKAAKIMDDARRWWDE